MGKRILAEFVTRFDDSFLLGQEAFQDEGALVNLLLCPFIVNDNWKKTSHHLLAWACSFIKAKKMIWFYENLKI